MIIIKNLEQWTLEWKNYRLWKITWTSLKWVTWWFQAQQTAIYELLAEEYIEEDDLNAWEAMERWNFLEPVAKKKYEDITWFKVEEVWFIERDSHHWLSPDGIIKTWDVYWQALEIKCPRWKNYVKYYLENKIPDEYKNQVVNYFLVMEDLECLHFMIYNPDTINGLPDYKIITVTRADLEVEIRQAEEKLTGFKTRWNTLKDNLLQW